MTEYTTWDKMRLGYAGILIIYLVLVVITLIIAIIGNADINLKLGLGGFAFAIMGIAITLVSSVMTDLEIRKIGK